MREASILPFRQSAPVGRAASTADRLPELQPTPPADPVPAHRVGRGVINAAVATVCHASPVAAQIEALARAGIEGVELFETGLDVWTENLAGLGQLCRSCGVHVVTLGPIRDFEGMTGPARSAAFDRAERWLDRLSELGTDLVFVCSNTSPESSGDTARITDDLGELAERAASRGMHIGYEALAWGRHVSSWRHADAIVRAVNRPDVGLIIDTFQTFAAGDPVSELEDIPIDRIAHVQIADGIVGAGDRLFASRNNRRLPGEGVIAIAPLVASLSSRGYGGWISLELFDGPHRNLSLETFAGAAAQAFDFAELTAVERV